MGLDDVLAYLTFRERFARKRVRFERRSGALILQVEGSPAPVRQRLGALLRSYRGIVPVNNPSDVPAGHDEEGLVVEQLQAMTEGCGYGGRVAHGLPIVFPRFAAAHGALRMAACPHAVPPATDRRPEAADQGGDHRGTPTDPARAAPPAESPPGRPVRQRAHGRRTRRPHPEGDQRLQIPAPPDGPLVRHPAFSPAAHLRGGLRGAGTAAERARGGEAAPAGRGTARRHRRALRCPAPPEQGPPPSGRASRRAAAAASPRRCPAV